MSCSPSSELCYGVSLMSDEEKIIPEDQLNNLQETLLDDVYLTPDYMKDCK